MWLLAASWILWLRRFPPSSGSAEVARCNQRVAQYRRRGYLIGKPRGTTCLHTGFDHGTLLPWSSVNECEKWSMGPKWVVHTTLIGVMAKFETSKNQNLSVTLSHSSVIIYVLNLGLSNLSLPTVFGYIQQSTSPKLIKHGS